jgi:hypothetical protein
VTSILSQPAPRSGQRVFLVEQQANPSTDFFVLPALTAQGCRIVRCGFSDLPAASDLHDAAVVFVRYVPPAWARLVEAARQKLGSVIFFMDDDVLDVRASVGMPWLYRIKLARLSAWRAHWMRRQRVIMWVSTPYLQQKYAGWSPKLMMPSPVEQPGSVRRVFYHGTASHAAEIRWLRPVMSQALEADENLAFEIVGGAWVYRLYRDLPRVNVIHPMKWPAYQAFLSMPGRHIGLVPLLDVPFNQARSCTKFFDVTRCGAVGVYAPGGACAQLVDDEIDGLVVKLETEAWVQAILRLARDEPLREQMLGSAQLKLAELRRRVQIGYPDLLVNETGG